MEVRLLQQTFMGMAHMTRMKSDRHVFKQPSTLRTVLPTGFEQSSLDRGGVGLLRPSLGIHSHHDEPQF
jgi:hypothetical protein